MTANVQLVWNGTAVNQAIQAGAARGLLLAAEHVLGESRKVVPIDEGTLTRSGATSVDAGQLVAAVSYNTPYAVRQHEDLGMRHDPGRSAKYLEIPWRGTTVDQAQIIATQIRAALGI